jgi:sigma-B regulation protein RsbU (phosphoserine phosphatase)
MAATLEMPSWPGAPTLLLDPLLESERLDALRSLNLLDTPAEARFDRVTRLAAEFFRMPIAYVAFVDHDRQWFKSSYGFCREQKSETSRSVSFCQYTIQKNEPLIIPDTHLHPIGKNHPLVVGEPYIRFYAGVPLAGPRGQKIGTFCLVDMEPHAFGAEKIEQLMAFAAIIEREVNLGRIVQSQNELLKTRQELIEAQQALNREFTEAAQYVRMMLPPPLSGEEIIDWQFHPSVQLGGDGLGYRRINDDLLAIYVLDVTGHGFGAALLAVTALEVLRNPAVQIDFSQPALVMERFNRVFQMKDHGGKFFSIWYGVYSRSARTLTYANAGHPPPLLLTPGRDALVQTASGDSVLGIFPEIHVKEIKIPVPRGSEIYLFTDGLYEVLDPEGGRGSYDEFLSYLQTQTATGKPVWDAMLHWFDRARDKRIVDDDVSMLRFAPRS